ncbi:flotillin family protein [Acidaminobacter sp. JC074]|uniref:flotillin family protein n=1 Tax=Acidaminobacter sp. JC074 TaxID=2530199 RepID=UPI001F0EFCD8|nr:flotillin family protein [Acidaminobacter sp. JC074]MCH4889732.1 flotillin family protein [Acidaminobacter sp. JC074]
MTDYTPIFLIVIAVFVFGMIVAVFSRYKKCPSDKILVKYGKVSKSSAGDQRSANCIHGGAAFIWPVFQSYAFLDLTPISIEVNLTNALSKQNIRVDVPSRFTVGISTEAGVMQNAAERLLGLKLPEIQELAKDIIFGQLRLVVATMDIEEINTDRDKFLAAVSSNVETELKKIGLRLINVNVTDINDESGYIVALGKEAAAKAINEARVSVAEKTKDGSIGEANAQRDQRVQVAEANATAVEGENLTKVTIANSDASRREMEAKANKQAVSAEKIQSALALQEAYVAEEAAERARANKERATREADELVIARVEKEKIEIAAEAEAERIRRHAKGEADAIFAKMSAQADGINAMLMKQAEGFKEVVKASGGSADDAVKLMIADKMEDLVKIQVEAIKNLKIDKVTVWDSMSGGSPNTADFLSGMMKAVPPMNEMFKMAGMDLPKFLGSDVQDKLDDAVKETVIEELE